MTNKPQPQSSEDFEHKALDFAQRIFNINNHSGLTMGDIRNAAREFQRQAWEAGRDAAAKTVEKQRWRMATFGQIAEAIRNLTPPTTTGEKP